MHPWRRDCLPARRRRPDRADSRLGSRASLLFCWRSRWPIRGPSGPIRCPTSRPRQVPCFDKRNQRGQANLCVNTRQPARVFVSQSSLFALCTPLCDPLCDPLCTAPFGNNSDLQPGRPRPAPKANRPKLPVCFLMASSAAPCPRAARDLGVYRREIRVAQSALSKQRCRGRGGAVGRQWRAPY